jgi:hypothetical protein
MDEAALAAWQHALVDALLHAHTAAEIRARLLAALPDARDRIAALDDRALAVAIDLVRRWSPQRG